MDGGGGACASTTPPAPESLASHSTVPQPALRCPICLDDAESPTFFECGHSACSECLVDYLNSLVGSGQVSGDQMRCPIPDCRQTFSKDFLARVLLCGRRDEQHEQRGKQLHDKLLDFQAQRYVPEADDNEKLVACPTAGCGQILVPTQVVNARENVTCPVCSAVFCAACSQLSHGNLSCETAELQRMDPELRKLLGQEDWVRCPSCRNLCERESGCNFMTCPSAQCQSQTHFCFLCGELLAATDHASHYEGFEGAVGRRGPFGSVCLNKRTTDLSLPQKPLPPRLTVEEGEDSGIVLRITFAEHKSTPPTIYYHVRLMDNLQADVRSFRVGVHSAYFDLRPSRQVQKYRRYQVIVAPVNVNGEGPASEASDVVHFHEREAGMISSNLRDGSTEAALRRNLNPGAAVQPAAQQQSKGKRWNVR